MQGLFSLLASVLVLTATHGAFAQEGWRPDRPGHPGRPGDPGRPGRPGPGPRDLCSGEYHGIWERGRGVQLSLNIQPGWRDQVEVFVTGPNARDRAQGTCRYNNDGSAVLTFNNERLNGHLLINTYAQIYGRINNVDFSGDRRGGYDDDPRPGPNDLCYGRIEGVWGYKGGRPMTLIVDREWGPRVRVTVIQRNGTEETRGVCERNRDGSVQVRFDGANNNGNVTVYPNGNVQGVVTGFSYRGSKR
ncbi:MAG: hypothetical protein HC902_09185 [Calothrix sp. SM1_5_4]|nr:hypothetical protein [Calothrix sp. SM1_5_4]